jgi:pilus assembly protein FimV
MKPHSNYLFAIFGIAALCVAMNSAALTLGRASGSVFLGQALRLTVPVQMEVGEGSAALCFEADVFYGDTRQDASRVSVSSELLPKSQAANVTVSAQGAVDEPVVTVYLRAGCDGKTTRRYVLLAEMAAPVVASASSPLPASMKPQLQSRANVVPRDAKPVQPPAAHVAASAPGVASAFTQGVAPSRRVSNRRAQLKLEPLDLTQDRDPTLKLSTELLAQEGEDLQRRARAEALWRSLNITPQEIQAIDSRQQGLVLDLRNLQGLTAKNQQLLDGMTHRLGRAESGRYANPVVYGLLASIIGCGLAIAWIWSRRPRDVGLTGEPWWRDERPSNSLESGESREGGVPNSNSIRGDEVQQRPAMPQSASVAGAPAPSAAGVAHVDIDVLGVDPMLADSSSKVTGRDEDKAEVEAQRQPLPRAMGHVDFGHSMSASLLRSVNSKEMLDVRQQAEFFMTLGQNEEAIAMLRDSVDAGPDADPMVYLALLKALHTLGRKVEYDHYRNGFHSIFNGYIPVYSDYGQPGSGLEAYPAVCQRIVGVWPSEEAVAYIESCLIRTRKESAGQIFDLEAFRDLLLLHGVASRLASSSLESGFMAFSATKPTATDGPDVPGADMDLDLSEPTDGNLIDFDASGWSAPLPGATQVKGP